MALFKKKKSQTNIPDDPEKQVQLPQASLLLSCKREVVHGDALGTSPIGLGERARKSFLVPSPSPQASVRAWHSRVLLGQPEATPDQAALAPLLLGLSRE